MVEKSICAVFIEHHKHGQLKNFFVNFFKAKDCYFILLIKSPTISEEHETGFVLVLFCSMENISLHTNWPFPLIPLPYVIPQHPLSFGSSIFMKISGLQREGGDRKLPFYIGQFSMAPTYDLE